MTVICAIDSTRMKKEQKKEMISEYINKVAGIESKEKMDIQYDLKDLSKVSLWGRLCRTEVNVEEKLAISKSAVKAQRHEIAKIKGEYKPSLKERFISWFTGNQPTFPVHKEKDFYKVASKYNEMAYDEEGNKKTKQDLEKTFKEKLKEDAKLEDGHKDKLSKGQRQELKSLVKNQMDEMEK